MNSQFVDISSWQSTNIDWPAYKAWSAAGDGIARLSIRSSYGTGFTDQNYRAFRPAAEAEGIQIIHYHYAYPNLNSPEAEADWQAQVVGQIGPNDVLMLDYEENVPQATANWAYLWLTRQERNYSGRLPTIYASDSFIRARLQDSRLARYPLTLANWQFSPDARPACPPPWSQYTYLQYTDRATNIPGIPGSVDANVYMGGATMQQYNPQSGDFSAFFTATDADHWQCKQTGKIVQYGIKHFFSGLSTDGNTLPIIGLPVTDEIYMTVSGQTVVLQVFERAGIWYDPGHVKDTQPGTGNCALCHLPDSDFLKYVPGLALPTQPTMPNIADALAQLKMIGEAVQTTIAPAIAKLEQDLKQ